MFKNMQQSELFIQKLSLTYGKENSEKVTLVWLKERSKEKVQEAVGIYSKAEKETRANCD